MTFRNPADPMRIILALENAMVAVLVSCFVQVFKIEVDVLGFPCFAFPGSPGWSLRHLLFGGCLEIAEMEFGGISTASALSSFSNNFQQAMI